ncbi:MAG TPA: SDR family NAD(P)-dependent oxidoreductase [Solirubrobacterales bacterium]|jgi:NAD(P)-dependent dehydrogenase (short-subunit alcohol dehydrogenase family)|nr:SDR family NAD(P)-dependent oxidoreductase [Solirubrobacterales bacterium]
MTEEPAHTLPRLDLSLDGRIALVTGAGRGIGRATSRRLAAHGAVIVALARTGSQLDSVTAEIEAVGGRCLPIVCDVTDYRRLEEAFVAIEREFGTLHVLVNNAGGARWLRPIEELPPEDFDAGLRLNLNAAHAAMRLAAPLLFANPGKASVVNVGSIAAASGLEQLAYYSAAKFGLDGLTRAAAREWGRRGVRVNAVGPGWTETDLSGSLRRNEDFFRKTLDRIALGRWGAPEEIADGIVYLASDAARYVTGTTLFVDGGFLA